MSAANPNSPPKKISTALKLALEIGPLIVFFFVYNRTDIYAASIVLVAAVLTSLAITYILTRHIPILPLVTAVLVTIFGFLTYYLHDPTFIKIKATIIYCLFGAALLGGLLFNKSLLAVVLDAAFSIDEKGWRILTLRWGLFFLFLAALNECVWRNASEEVWVKFKTFGFLPLTVLFALAQTPLILRHEVKDESNKSAHDHF